MHERFEINLQEAVSISFDYSTLFFLRFVLSPFFNSLFFHFLHISNTRINIYSCKNLSDERIEYLKFFFLSKEIETRNSFLLFFFLCIPFLKFLFRWWKRDDAFIFLFLFIHWNWKKESLNYCILIFYLREIILINFNALQICSKITKFKYLNLVPFKFDVSRKPEATS